MKPLDLTLSAKKQATGGRGRPRQSDLRRSVSTVCYGLFHCVAITVADSMIGTNKNDRNNLAYRQIYRGVTHTQIRQNCNRQHVMKDFPPEIQLLGNLITEMYDKRNEADYDPFGILYRSEVLRDIRKVEGTINSFYKLKSSERRVFAAYVAFKTRNI